MLSGKIEICEWVRWVRSYRGDRKDNKNVNIVRYIKVNHCIAVIRVCCVYSVAYTGVNYGPPCISMRFSFRYIFFLNMLSLLLLLLSPILGKMGRRRRRRRRETFNEMNVLSSSSSSSSLTLFDDDKVAWKWKKEQCCQIVVSVYLHSAD